MNDEIKEILQNIKKVAKRETASRNTLMEMKNTDYQLLLDYITNLQQENERLKEQNNDLRKTYRNTYNKLFENGNDELARYFQAQIDDCPSFYVEPIIDYHKEWKDYKSRCEKADEYINYCDDLSVINDYSFNEKPVIEKRAKKNLLNILNGKE